MGAAFELVDHLCAGGVRGIVLFGDAGEYPAFSADERSRLIYLAVKRSRVPVLAGVGSATLDASLDLARAARDAGAAALLLPPPFFLRYDSDDLREFYLEFGRQLGRGTALFLTIPPGCSDAIPSETAIELLASGLFAGIEDGRGSLESYQEMQAAANGGLWQVLAGNDAIFTRARCAGARAAISAAAGAVPELVTALDRAICVGRQEPIEKLDFALQEFLAWAACFPAPVAVKAALGLRGLKTGSPSVPLSSGKLKRMDEFREWFQAWLPAVKRLSANG